MRYNRRISCRQNQGLHCHGQPPSAKQGPVLKAKGLLSLMLSLPEDWDYTTRGLSCICKDGVDSIRLAFKNLRPMATLFGNVAGTEMASTVPSSTQFWKSPASGNSASCSGKTYIGKSNAGNSHAGFSYAGDSRTIRATPHKRQKIALYNRCPIKTVDNL